MNKTLLAQLTLLAVTAPAFAQSTLYFDNNGTTAGFGSLSGNWNTATSRWTTSAAGTSAPAVWVNNVGTPNNAILDYTSGAGNIVLTQSLNIGNLTAQNYGAAVIGTAFTSTNTVASNTTIALSFGSGATLDIADNTATGVNSDFSIRVVQATTGVTQTINVNGGFTKTGAGVLQFNTTAQTAASATAIMNITGTVAVQAGGIALLTSGSIGTRMIDVSGATFALSSGTLLAAVNTLSSTIGTPASGAANLGIVSGTGTIRGDATVNNTLTYSATGLQPGTLGTIGTLNIADNTTAGTSVTINTATITGNTAFTFANIAVGGLKFDLAAPGDNDKLALSGLSSVNLAGLNFNQFAFNTLSGFGGGSYTLIEGLTSVTGTLGTATGTIGGLDAALSYDTASSRLLLSVTPIPEPSGYAALAGVGMIGFALYRRRLSGA